MSEQQENEKYTVIESNDGFEYVCLKKYCTEGSKMLKGMLDKSSMCFLVSHCAQASSIVWALQLIGIHFTNMFEILGPFKEATENRVRLQDFRQGYPYSPPDITVLTTNSGSVVEQVCLYFYYKHKYAGDTAVPAMDVPLDLLLQMLVASDYLQC